MALTSGELPDFAFSQPVEGGVAQDRAGVQALGMDGGESAHHSFDGHGAGQAAVLKRGADHPGAHGTRRGAAVHGDRAGVGLVEPEDEVEKCGFTCTVGAEYGNDFAGVNR